MLLKSELDVKFAKQNFKDMCTRMSAYRRFAALMEEGECLRDNNVSFRRICRCLFVSPSSLNEILEKELGMNGEEVIDYYRKIQ